MSTSGISEARIDAAPPQSKKSEKEIRGRRIEIYAKSKHKGVPRQALANIVIRVYAYIHRFYSSFTNVCGWIPEVTTTMPSNIGDFIDKMKVGNVNQLTDYTSAYLQGCIAAALVILNTRTPEKVRKQIMFTHTMYDCFQDYVNDVCERSRRLFVKDDGVPLVLEPQHSLSKHYMEPRKEKESLIDQEEPNVCGYWYLPNRKDNDHHLFQSFIMQCIFTYGQQRPTLQFTLVNAWLNDLQEKYVNESTTTFILRTFVRYNPMFILGLVEYFAYWVRLQTEVFSFQHSGTFLGDGLIQETEPSHRYDPEIATWVNELRKAFYARMRTRDQKIQKSILAASSTKETSVVGSMYGPEEIIHELNVKRQGITAPEPSWEDTYSRIFSYEAKNHIPYVVLSKKRVLSAKSEKVKKHKNEIIGALVLETKEDLDTSSSYVKQPTIVKAISLD